MAATNNDGVNWPFLHSLLGMLPRDVVKDDPYRNYDNRHHIIKPHHQPEDGGTYFDGEFGKGVRSCPCPCWLLPCGAPAVTVPTRLPHGAAALAWPHPP